MRTLPWLVALLAGCPTSDDTDPPVPEDLSATLPANGPYRVGYREGSVTWETGSACVDLGPRTLRTAIWYPTDESPGEPIRYRDLFEAPGVIGDAAPSAGRFPLIVYSHGSKGYAEASGRLVSHLVSHGNIVVSADHTDNTFVDGDRTTAIYWQRPHDVIALLDQVLDPAHPLAGSLSDDPILAMGHSFGGYTLHALTGGSFQNTALFAACLDGTDTTEFCSTMTPAQQTCLEQGFRDPRITGVISMAPGDHRLFTTPGLAQVDVPVLLMTGGLDDVAQGDLNWDALGKPGNLRVHLTNGGHNMVADVAGGLDGPDAIDPEEGWSILGAYQLAWIRAQRGDTTVQPVLDGELVFGTTTELTAGD